MSSAIIVSLPRANVSSRFQPRTWIPYSCILYSFSNCNAISFRHTAITAIVDVVCHFRAFAKSQHLFTLLAQNLNSIFLPAYYTHFRIAMPFLFAILPSLPFTSCTRKKIHSKMCSMFAEPWHSSWNLLKNYCKLAQCAILLIEFDISDSHFPLTLNLEMSGSVPKRIEKQWADIEWQRVCHPVPIRLTQTKRCAEWHCVMDFVKTNRTNLYAVSRQYMSTASLERRHVRRTRGRAKSV